MPLDVEFPNFPTTPSQPEKKNFSEEHLDAKDLLRMASSEMTNSPSDFLPVPLKVDIHLTLG
jgi:hypothetical protein